MRRKIRRTRRREVFLLHSLDIEHCPSCEVPSSGSVCWPKEDSSTGERGSKERAIVYSCLNPIRESREVNLGSVRRLSVRPIGVDRELLAHSLPRIRSSHDGVLQNQHANQRKSDTGERRNPINRVCGVQRHRVRRARLPTGTGQLRA